MGVDAFILHGHAYSWRRLCEMRREQLEALRKARGTQPALFTLREDCRPATEKTGAGRYTEPSLFDAAAMRCQRPP